MLIAAMAWFTEFTLVAAIVRLFVISKVPPVTLIVEVAEVLVRTAAVAALAPMVRLPIVVVAVPP